MSSLFAPSSRHSTPETQEAPDVSDNPRKSSEGPLQKHPRLTKVAIALGAGAVILGGAGRGLQVSLAKTWNQRWGNLENPHFGLQPNVPLHSYSQMTYSVMNSSYKELLLSKLHNISPTPPEAPITKKTTPSSIALPEEYSPQTSIELARALCESALGKKLPPSVTFTIDENSGSYISGTANSLSENVVANWSSTFPSDKANFYETTGTLIHEVGHLVFRLNEEKFTTLPFWEASSYETRVREEAVAILFRLSVAAQVSDPQARFFLGGNLESFVNQHLSGDTDYGFVEGGALCDAALTLTDGDFVQAWQMLTVPGELDPALYEIIEDNKRLSDEIKDLQMKLKDS